MAAHPEHMLDKGLARQSYMSAIDRSARLTAFSLAERLVDGLMKRSAQTAFSNTLTQLSALAW
jgi:hypothetical protein